MHLYCTLFDRNYITRGLALYGSLLRHRKEFKLVVLCLDGTTLDVLTTLALPNLELVPMSVLEESDPELRRARTQRTMVEYYFTCKPVLMKFIAESSDARWITYLDSDLFYFSDPLSLEREYAGCSVALTPHRFPERLSERNQFGRFNAGWVSASCSEEGRRFIDWWRARCIEWCRLEVQDDRFGDQKYLDRVPALFSDVAVLDHGGANLAPWNLDGRNIYQSEDGLAVDGKPLVFFHFHGVRKVLGKLYDSGLREYQVPLSAQLLKNLYQPYLAKLSDEEAVVSEILERMSQPTLSSPMSLIELLRKLKRTAELLSSRTYVIQP